MTGGEIVTQLINVIAIGMIVAGIIGWWAGRRDKNV